MTKSMPTGHGLVLFGRLIRQVRRAHKRRLGATFNALASNRCRFRAEEPLNSAAGDSD